MATYTMELWRAIESLDDGQDIGLNDYPLFDENYRETLNNKILNHYDNREIGHETVDMFRFALRRKMAEIMPFYNRLYESERLEFDPLSTVDLTTSSTGETVQESVSHAESETSTENRSGSRAVQSTTPQMQLRGNADYASGAADTTSTAEGGGTGEETSNSTVTGDSLSETRMKGYQGSAASLLMAYRESLLNIDMMIISELSELFMMVWDNADSFTRGRIY